MNETLNGPREEKNEGLFLPKVLKKHRTSAFFLRGLMCVGRTPG